MHHAGLANLQLTKEEGGLGFADLKSWNKAVYCTLVFGILAEENNMWVQWIHTRMLKSKEFWTMKVPKDCSWVWRNILLARDKAKECIEYVITDGKSLSLWYTPWCNRSLLSTNAVARAEIPLPVSAKVSDLITNGQWNNLVTNIQDVQFMSMILGVEISRFLIKDRVAWKLTESGQASVATVYRVIRGSKPIKRWASLVWGSLVQPSHSFTTWQLLTRALPTQDRLKQKKVVQQSQCPFCGIERENSQHLFFQCHYTNNIWVEIKKMMDLHTVGMSNNQEWNYLFRVCRNKDQIAEIRKAFVCATMAAIWRERNFRHFRGTSQTWQIVRDRIICDVRSNLQCRISSVKDTIIVRNFITKLDLQVGFKQRPITICKWISPAEGTLKLNSDGSLRSKSYGYGGLLRDYTGKVLLCYSGSEGKKTVIEQELLGILRGIQACKDIGGLRLEVCSDSLRAINILKRKEGCPWHCENLVAEIKLEACTLIALEFAHVYRETNRVADYLASLAESGTKCVISIPPLDARLIDIVRDDLEVSYVRIG